MEKAVIWDWNGTLLNDVRRTFELTNKMLEERSKPKLELEEHCNKFSFPIIDCYMKLGFGFLNEGECSNIIREFNSKYKKHMS